ncbi:MAG: DNA (cytosine-5-)-methyltransferase [Bacteroidia bacterium]|nr:MAG: DNA (cytosine-5-)-methyltransferase [Bacteroidia bacterium]
MDCVEICAGAGGMALGLERAGFQCRATVEIDASCCNTLRRNRPSWQVLEQDVRSFDGKPFRGVDLLAGGVPCPPFSVAGRQLGADDERDLFPEALRLVEEMRPRAVLLENVKGFLSPVFESYREELLGAFDALGYRASWRLLNASDFGVSQLRPRVLIVAFRKGEGEHFRWPVAQSASPRSVGELLADLMGANGWPGLDGWVAEARQIAPTVVGGSKKHGGPDLGPTRARQAWATLGVDGRGIAKDAPAPDFEGMPRLTVRMVARLQGFPDDWEFTGSKTAAYRQVGNALPPAVSHAVGLEIRRALEAEE